MSSRCDKHLHRINVILDLLVAKMPPQKKGGRGRPKKISTETVKQTKERRLIEAKLRMSRNRAKNRGKKFC